jgi:hypothetical protein
VARFPLPTKTDESGRFIIQAEFAQPGRYRLRVLDPDSGVMSKTLLVSGNVFTMKYRVSSGTGTFQSRRTCLMR